MAVTNRELHQHVPWRLVGSRPWIWRFDRLGPAVQFGVSILLASLCFSLATGWGRIWIDDLRYGRPRTQHVTGTVGHNEASGEPTHFITMNLNRRVVVIELPGGDVSKAQTLQGPYLFGANEDLTPASARLEDVNGDGKNDLIVAVKREEVIYINTGESFRLINADERQQLGQVR